MGWRYLFIALDLQVKHGTHAYDYGEESGLLARLEKGWKFEDFNLEQQGDIAACLLPKVEQSKRCRALGQPILNASKTRLNLVKG